MRVDDLITEMERIKTENPDTFANNAEVLLLMTLKVNRDNGLK